MRMVNFSGARNKLKQVLDEVANDANPLTPRLIPRLEDEPFRIG